MDLEEDLNFFKKNPLIRWEICLAKQKVLGKK